MSRILFRGADVVTADRVIPGGWVLVEGDTITAVGDPTASATALDADTGLPADGSAEGAQIVELAGMRLLPGLIDLHVHGAAGASFDEGPAAIDTGLAAHARHGTTRSLVSLVTAPLDDLARRTRVTAQHLADRPRVWGIHLEGPFLSEKRRGVHDPAALRDPEPAAVQWLLDAGDGRVRVLTLAPELAGGVDAVRQLVAAGVHPAVGHSDADYDCAAAAFDAGADLVTHAFNGMRPLHHRDPAILGAAMDAGVVLEAINDGVHLHPATVRLLRSVAPGRVALVTDAMAAACHGDGRYALAGFDVEVSGGVARLVTDDPQQPGSIAGSTLTLDVAVQRAVTRVGMPLPEAVAAASLVPAQLLGMADRHGSIATGKVADLVVTDPDGEVLAVLADGDWLDERRP